MTTPLIILGLLLAPLLLLTPLAGRVVDWRTRGSIGLALVFLFTGVGHFVRTVPMAKMLPLWLPGKIPLVYATGVLELAVALLVLLPATRRFAGWTIIAMLIVFLPVNIYAAIQGVGMGGHQWGPVYLWVRVPLQLLLIGWTWWFATQPAADVPVRFTCYAELSTPPEQIANDILDLSRWPEFEGYGLLPGIREAVFEVRTEEVIGTRIRATNTDGSMHTEEIIEWQPSTRIAMRFDSFTPPLSRLATHFIETWNFERVDATTTIHRSFEMHATSDLTRPCLVLMSSLLRRAIAHHLAQIRAAERQTGEL